MNVNGNGTSPDYEPVRPVLSREDVIRLLARAGSPAQLKLSGYSLNRADLANFDLQGANLSNSDLTRVNLSGANLSGASLANSNLFIANLSGANLGGANLSGAKINPAELSRADLSYANLSEADLSSTDLSTAVLQGANFSGADLTDVYLTAIQKEQLLASGVSFRGANEIRLVFLSGEAASPPDVRGVSPARVAAPAPALPVASGSAAALNCRIEGRNITAVAFSALVEAVARLHFKLGLIKQGRYPELVELVQTGQVHSATENGLVVRRLGSDGDGLTVQLEQAAPDPSLLAALKVVLDSPVQAAAEQALGTLSPSLTPEFKSTLARMLRPELVALAAVSNLTVEPLAKPV